MSKLLFQRSLRIWHKRIGLCSALVVLLLAVTGIFLNHSGELKLGNKAINQPLLLSLYGIEVATIKAKPLTINQQKHWLSAVEKHIFLNEKNIYQCQSNFINALSLDNYWLVACENSLLVFDLQHNLLEVIDENFGLPVPLHALYHCEQQVCIDNSQHNYQLDMETLVWREHSGSTQIATFKQPPEELTQRILQQYNGTELNWERLLLDLHAGRFMGSIGPWAMDFIALLFIILVISGWYLWLSTDQRRAHKHKQNIKRRDATKINS